jgi:cobaltochelatase CobS
MIDFGISARMCVYAMCLHWPEVSRENAGVATMDFLAESESNPHGFHTLYGYVRKLALAAKGQDFGISLIGPSGTGKSRLAKQIAASIQTESHPDGLPYGETPMTPGATRGDLLGRITMEGYIPSQFVEIYSGGGVFNFEEMDASDPSMLIVVNNALASGELFNSVNGQKYVRHEDFIAFSTMNTYGLGANAKYTGREKLDLATIDRFRMCRAVISLDESLAERIIGK